MAEGSYTLVVWFTDKNGDRVREAVNPDWRMPFHWADQKAAELNRRYGPDRTYKAVNVRDAG